MPPTPTNPAPQRHVMLAELPRIAQLTAWAEDFARRANLSSDLSFAIQLCVEEAVANIIMYSGAAERHEDIAIELTETGADVLAVIEDGGPPFDPTGVAPPPKPTSIEDAQVGGYGIHLMRNFASEMRYERRDGRNRLTLRFSPPQAA